MPKIFKKERFVPRMESVAQIIALLAVLFWLRFVFERPSLLLGPAAATYRLGSLWQDAVVPTLAIFAVSIAQAVVNLFRPDWLRFRRIVSIITDLAALGLGSYLLRGAQWVALAHLDGDGGDVLATLNQWVYYGLGITAGAIVLSTLSESWKPMRAGAKTNA